MPVQRLELKQIRVCQRCGRGRAELETADGRRLAVPLDAVRARELSGEEPALRWLTDVVLVQLRASGVQPAEVVLDAGPGGLRALLSIVRNEDTDVIACTAQEGIGFAVRGRLRLYATDDALATDAPPSTGDPGRTVH